MKGYAMAQSDFLLHDVASVVGRVASDISRVFSGYECRVYRSQHGSIEIADFVNGKALFPTESPLCCLPRIEPIKFEIESGEQVIEKVDDNDNDENDLEQLQSRDDILREIEHVENLLRDRILYLQNQNEN